MKYIRATVRVDEERAPAFFNLLANSGDIAEARVLEVNTTVEGVDNYLFAIDGDPATFAERATETPGVESVELADADARETYALVVVDSLETPMYDAIQRSSGQGPLVIQKPIVYRDGKLYGHGVGDPEAVRDALDELPDAVDVQFDVVGQFRPEVYDPVAGLSDRQREALTVAHALGYYEQPRACTHEDVAAELGCAPQTASDHLQKAEAKVVAAVLDEFGRSV